MKVVEYDRYGDPAVLVVRERPDPVARPGRVVVRVRAAALNPKDVLTRTGKLQDSLRISPSDRNCSTRRPFSEFIGLGIVQGERDVSDRSRPWWPRRAAPNSPTLSRAT
jgi:hypothetical protein